uniref:Uncharacterized protein n=1 Tax=Leviviridae sp. TaxID=2027243 RepID=A0A514D5N7_9VIRU|nr:MAG: hypothetical protein H4Bulk472253_000002 [Leviviridae sp.]
MSFCSFTEHWPAALFQLGEPINLTLRVEQKGEHLNMSKHDYNFQMLLVVLLIMLGITGIAALGALMMFMTAFM